MIVDFILDNFLQLATTLALGIAWLVDKRKRKAETDTVRSSALDNLDALYDKFSERYAKEYEALLQRIKVLEDTLEESRKDRGRLLDRIEVFEKQGISDKGLIDKLTIKVNRQQITIESQRGRINELEKKST